MSDQIRTTEELNQLKTNWAKDPCWDIEDTEGFEAYHDELKAWREERERQLEIKWREAEDERIEKIMPIIGMGKADRETLLALSTFSEIETESRNIERVTDDPNVAIQAMHIRATLLQAAQLKRIADALENIADGDSLSNSVKIWGSEQ